jgi:prevent-host-death family protein
VATHGAGRIGTCTPVYALFATTGYRESVATIGIRELRSALAAMVRRAETGERLVVTVDGRPIAQLGPVDATSSAVSMDDLVGRGQVIAPRRRSTYMAPEPIFLRTGARIDQALREIRT